MLEGPTSMILPSLTTTVWDARTVSPVIGTTFTFLRTTVPEAAAPCWAAEQFHDVATQNAIRS
jgi:hypothetical protein